MAPPSNVSASIAKRTVVRASTSSKTTVPAAPPIKPPASFPDELVEDILIRVWLGRSWKSFKERWYFYCASQLVNKQWCRIIRTVMLKYVILESLLDFQVYDFLLKRMLEDDAPEDAPEDPTDAVSPTQESVAEGKQPRKEGRKFNTALIRIPGSRTTSYNLSTFTHGRWKLFIPSCKHCMFFLRGHCRLADVTIFGKDGLSLRTVTFMIAASIELEDANTLATEAVRFPEAKTVHILRCPSADVKRVSTNLVEVKAILSAFPNLKHLTMNSPISLVPLTSYLSKLETLTLEIPPVYIKSYRATSVHGWNIFAALKASGPPNLGEDEPPPGDVFRPKRLIISTEQRLPNGWDQLAEVCEQYDVELVHQVDYGAEQMLPGSMTARREAQENIMYSLCRFKSHYHGVLDRMADVSFSSQRIGSSLTRCRSTSQRISRR